MDQGLLIGIFVCVVAILGVALWFMWQKVQTLTQGLPEQKTVSDASKEARVSVGTHQLTLAILSTEPSPSSAQWAWALAQKLSVSKKVLLVDCASSQLIAKCAELQSLSVGQTVHYQSNLDLSYLNPSDQASIDQLQDYKQKWDCVLVFSSLEFSASHLLKQCNQSVLVSNLSVQTADSFTKGFDLIQKAAIPFAGLQIVELNQQDTDQLKMYQMIQDHPADLLIAPALNSQQSPETHLEKVLNGLKI